MRDYEDLERAKKNLVLTLMKNQFEENMAKYFSTAQYSSIEELDKIVDKKLRRYYEECDMVREFYNQRISDS